MLLMKLFLMLNLMLIRRIVCLTAGDSWSCENVSSVQEGVFEKLFQIIISKEGVFRKMIPNLLQS